MSSQTFAKRVRMFLGDEGPRNKLPFEKMVFMGRAFLLWERPWNAIGKRILEQSKGNASENRERLSEKKRLLVCVRSAVRHHGRTVHERLVEQVFHLHVSFEYTHPTPVDRTGIMNVEVRDRRRLRLEGVGIIHIIIVGPSDFGPTSPAGRMLIGGAMEVAAAGWE